MNKAVQTGTHFMMGDVACAEGALAAGCRFFAGYPITPSTETAEHMAARLPEVGGFYVQMEDELGSIAAVLGASWGGLKAMTATSGPGFSLMQENIGLGIMTETPCVIVNVQRAGPSTGLPTMVGQGDMQQARWGSHGPYEIIALCPWSVQECFDLTVRAFNLSERYRLPVLVMTDAEVGHMIEKLVIPPAEEIELWERQRPTLPPGQFPTYQAEAGRLVPPMPELGQGYHVSVTGLTHDERGYPDMSAEAQEALVRRIIAKVQENVADILDWQERDVDDADVVVVAYGITARVASHAVREARAGGIRAGLFRLITAWPFPEARVRDLARQGKRFVVPEINYGQMSREVERCVGIETPVLLVPHAGGDIHESGEILGAIRTLVSR
ncbi:MAG: 2-oxoacid:acceptor oxidoreductase subunit alpha [Anaerolineae bacterium]|nr:2-oxoacid:acceptor oxidoreductase subunit alpha [Anaerolineae bacterium]